MEVPRTEWEEEGLIRLVSVSRIGPVMRLSRGVEIREVGGVWALGSP